MKTSGLLWALFLVSPCWGGTASAERQEAEYYIAAYARHYNVPLEFVRAVVEQESGWHRCAISSKGAAGLMQLMPATAARMNVRDPCSISQNISGGVRYLAWLLNKFHGELRLVAAAYYAGARVVAARGLRYANPDVVLYVAGIRERVERQRRFRGANIQRTPGRTR
jgi:soluble lytic murein transglycosylase-like protein